MNRNQYIDTKEKLTEIDEDFVVEKGQIFKEKAFDDEYILILDVGPHVNEDAPGMVFREMEFDLRYFTCNARGVPERRRGKNGVNGETYWQKDKIREFYFYTNKKANEDSMMLCNDKSEFEKKHGISYASIDIVEKPEKDRRTKEERDEQETHEANQRKIVLQEAGFRGLNHGTFKY